MPNKRSLVSAGLMPDACREPIPMLAKGHMRSRFGAILLGIAVLAVAACDYVWLQGLGFPDGHLTELDRATMSS
jgi:hypothetical protein